MLTNLNKLFESDIKHKETHRDSMSHEARGDYSGTAYYHNLIEASITRTPKPTLGLISAYPGLEFGCTPTALIDKLGEPELNLYTKKEHLLFYRSKTAGYKQRCEFHFHQSRLFYVRRTFSNITFLNADEIISALRAKYLDGRRFDPEHEKLVDEQGNEIFAREVDELQLDYLRAHRPTFEINPTDL